MSSPKSTWTGLIRLGMLAVPVSISKAVEQKRESGLKDICTCHSRPLDRTERCQVTKSLAKGKTKGVEVGPDAWQPLNQHEMTAIEDATKSDTLDVLDVQPLRNLPLEFSMGCYYVRADKKVKGAEQPMAVLTLALAKSNMGLVVKWSNSSSQKLCVIHAQPGTAILLMRQIPMVKDIRAAGEDERRHFKADVTNNQIDQMVDLLEATQNPEGFQHADYVDNGYNLRKQAVDNVLNGEVPEPNHDPDAMIPAQDVMEMIRASIELQKTKSEV